MLRPRALPLDSPGPSGLRGGLGLGHAGRRHAGPQGRGLGHGGRRAQSSHGTGHVEARGAEERGRSGIPPLNDVCGEGGSGRDERPRDRNDLDQGHGFTKDPTAASAATTEAANCHHRPTFRRRARISASSAARAARWSSRSISSAMERSIPLPASPVAGLGARPTCSTMRRTSAARWSMITDEPLVPGVMVGS